MTKTIEIVERINSHANSWERDDALDAREPTEEARFWRETALTIQALVKALEPFAGDAENWDEMGDTRPLENDGISKLTDADLRRARAILSKLKEAPHGK